MLGLWVILFLALCVCVRACVRARAPVCMCAGVEGRDGYEWLVTVSVHSQQQAVTWGVTGTLFSQFARLHSQQSSGLIQEVAACKVRELDQHVAAVLRSSNRMSYFHN